MPDEIASLIAELNSDEAAARLAAAERLGVLAEDAAPAAASLLARLDDEVTIREAAVSALESLGPPPASQVPELIARLRDPSGDVIYWAATLLGRLQDDASEAVPALATCLESKAAIAARERAAWALGQIGPAAAPARGALERAAAGDAVRLARLAKGALERIAG